MNDLIQAWLRARKSSYPYGVPRGRGQTEAGETRELPATDRAAPRPKAEESSPNADLEALTVPAPSIAPVRSVLFLVERGEPFGESERALVTSAATKGMKLGEEDFYVAAVREGTSRAEEEREHPARVTVVLGADESGWIEEGRTYGTASPRAVLSSVETKRAFWGDLQKVMAVLKGEKRG